MTERRALGAGPRPTTPAVQPEGSRRTRLAAETAEAPRTPAEAPPAVLRPSGRRQLGTGTDTATR
ncbi:hypothetical protein ACFQL8_37385 [Streptomyces goshikiensis]|uniref:hypothetical protein n=1 Tax=Streptomyces goshikiensis TaxID=1942 RepID=UPI001672DA96|nr:hypothetical protein [Streptomyces goshikiensis]